MLMNRREFSLMTLGLMCRDDPGTPKPRSVSLLVPAYFYPAGPGRKDWDRLTIAAKRVPIVVIANPASGPGTKRDPNYTEVLDQAVEAGSTLIGYISTSYGKRPADEAIADMDLWRSLYPQIRGFFFDEQASSAAKVDYYDVLARHARKTLPKALIVANPGTICDETYLAQKTSDVVCLFENVRGFDAFRPPPWAAKYETGRFAVIPYAIPDEEDMRKRLEFALHHRIGMVFLTDATGANPYDRLPRYWEAEVQAISAINSRGKR